MKQSGACKIMYEVTKEVIDAFNVCRNIPLSISSAQDGKAFVDTAALLQEREATITLDTSKPFKLNAGTTGVCE